LGADSERVERAGKVCAQGQVMKPLGPVDQLFLFIERRQQPIHVAGLQLFAFPDGADDDYVQGVGDHMREFDEPEPPFNLRLTTRLGMRYWDEDDQFDLDHHFRHEALPRPGRIRELLGLVSAEHANLLHRDRPLWEAHLIEGLSNRRFAIYTKVHHALIDGTAAMRLAVRSLSADPDERNMPPVWAIPRGERRPSSSNQEDGNAVERLTALLGKQLGTLPALARELGKLADKGQRHPDHVSIFQAPLCPLNERITGSRRFAAQSYSLTRIKALAKAFDATLNDVVLALCGGALRRYLEGIDALPEQPLIALVPISLRKDESEQGNQIAMILANLGTHVADPAERMRLVKASVQEAKQRVAQMTPEESLNFAALMLAPTFLNMVTGLAPQLHAFNVVISNVPGPREPLYWNGARMLGMYPVSLVIDRMALNITLTSYVDSLEFGIIGCRRTLPSMQRLLDHLERAIDDLELAAGARPA
jgi:diacylglycerol O-acyltransferase